MQRMLTVNRSRCGQWAYAIHAIQLLLRHRFQPFRILYCEDSVWHEAYAISAMAMRIGKLGGIFPGVARGATLRGDTMRLVLVKHPALLGLPLWFAMNWLGLERWNPLLIRADVTKFACDGNDTHAQADGEWLGLLPMTVSLDGDTVSILIPTAR
jgi:diacylglycerol kinase family enzyme